MLEKRSTLYLIGSLAILSVLILVAVTSFTSRPTTTSTTSTETKSGTPGHDSCVDNGFLTAQVDDTSGVYTFDIGTCAGLSGSTCFFAGNQTAFPKCNYILYPSGTSFASVRDFTTNVNYTESGAGLGTSLGVPTSSTVVGNSILTVFPPTAEGLVVTQNITVAGTTASTSVILMKMQVQNTNTANPQNVGIRYLWDTQVGGYDGTWLQQYSGATAGAILGNETDFNPPPATFTSYAMGGCSQDSVTPPPWTCNPVDFGSGSGTFTVFGSISSSVGATTPSRFIYGYWRAMVQTAYDYTPSSSNEVGSYVPNDDTTQDSAMLYYFPTQTIPSSGTMSDVALISNSQSAVITIPTTTTTTSSSTGTVVPSTPVTDTAIVAAVPSMAGTPTGSVQFYLCGPTATATSCAAVLGNAVGSPVTLSGGSAVSAAQSPSAVGFYCWSAVYTPNTTAFTGSSSTVTTNECFQVVATTTTTTTTTVTLPTTTTQTASTTSTATTTTTATKTSISTSTNTATSTSSTTATATSTSTVFSGTCYDPEATFTSTSTSYTTVTDTTTTTYYTTSTGTVTVTSASTSMVTTTSIVPVTVTTTEVSDTTVCATTVSTSPTVTSTTTTTVTSPTTTTQTASTTSTATATTATTTTSLASTTGTATSTSSATSTVKSTTTILSGTCYDPEVTVTQTSTSFAPTTETTTSTYYTTSTGTQTATATSTETFTTTTVVPVTTTTTEVSSTTECLTTVSSSSSTVTPPVGVPQFPLGSSLAVAAIGILALAGFMKFRSPRKPVPA